MADNNNQTKPSAKPQTATPRAKVTPPARQTAAVPVKKDIQRPAQSGAKNDIKAEKRKERKKAGGGINTNYLTKMGFRNLVSNHSMTLSSVSVLTACLLLIGVSLMILFNIQTMVSQVENQNIVVVFVKDDASESETEKVGRDLKSIKNVLNVEFVSKEDAFTDQLDSFGVEAKSFKDLVDNPLPDSFNVTVGNVETFQSTLVNIKNVANVSSVRESQELVGQITALQTSVSAICAVIVILLLVVSIFIITNTIRITMVSRKVDIEVMKSVGATNRFVRWPFIVEGISIGIISAVFALGLTYLVDYLEGDAFSSLLAVFGGTQSLTTFQKPWVIALCYVGAGILMGIFGSIVSMAKYLRKEGSEANEL